MTSLENPFFQHFKFPIDDFRFSESKLGERAIYDRQRGVCYWPDGYYTEKLKFEKEDIWEMARKKVSNSNRDSFADFDEMFAEYSRLREEHEAAGTFATEKKPENERKIILEFLGTFSRVLYLFLRL